MINGDLISQRHGQTDGQQREHEREEIEATATALTGHEDQSVRKN